MSWRRLLALGLLAALPALGQEKPPEVAPAPYQISLSPIFSQALNGEVRLAVRVRSLARDGTVGPRFSRTDFVGPRGVLCARTPRDGESQVQGQWAIPVVEAVVGEFAGLAGGESLEFRANFRIPAFEAQKSDSFELQWVGRDALAGLRSNLVTIKTMKHDKPVVTLETSLGDVQVELWPELAPNHVANLITLAQKGYYDGLIFHRVIPGFMVQTGCPQGSGSGGPGYRIAAEFNPTEFKKGVLGMARTQDPNSGGSQFFICVADASFLTGEYTAFGRVMEGQSVADSISKAPRNSQDRPHDEISIRKIQVTLPEGYQVPEVAKFGK